MRKLILPSVLFAFLASSCKSDLRDQMKAEIDSRCKVRAENCSFKMNLQRFTEFKWTKFYYFKSGTSLEQIDSVLGIHYPYWQDLSESLVFLLGDSIVYHEEYGMPDPEKAVHEVFSFNIEAKKYTTESAMFQLVRSQIGDNLYYEMVNASDGL